MTTWRQANTTEPRCDWNRASIGFRWRGLGAADATRGRDTQLGLGAIDSSAARDCICPQRRRWSIFSRSTWRIHPKRNREWKTIIGKVLVIDWFNCLSVPFSSCLYFSLFSCCFFFYFSFFSSLFVFPSSLIKASTLYWLSKCSGERVIFGRYFIKSAKRTLLILISPFARCCWLPLLLLLFLRLLIALLLVLKRSLRFVPSIWFASCLVLFCYNEIKYCISGLVASWPFWTFYGLNRLCRL